MSDVAQEEGWQRLDPRMLLVYPVREVVRFLPALIVVAVAGSGSGPGGASWELLGVAVPVAIGLLRYLTTRVRISPERVELRSGLLSRSLLSAPLDRVRTVDLTASLVHRVLGLSTVRIGTGSTDTDQRLELDALRTADARRLRDDLLRVAVVPSAGDATPAWSEGEPGTASGPVPAPPPPVLVLDPTWARYAPLTTTGVAALAGILGVGGQLLGSTDGSALTRTETAVQGSGAPAWVLVALPVSLALVASVVFAVVGYLAAYWGFTLRRADGSWHLVRGLLTTRETSIDEDRLAGVRLHEPLALRLAGAARLSAIVTGLPGRESGSTLLAPPAPREQVADVAGAVLGIGDPLATPLVAHGPAAVRRRLVRALVPAAVLVTLALVAVLLGDRSAWWLLPAGLTVPVSFALGTDRARSLGHAHREGRLLARSGSLARREDVLGDTHVIGWTWRATWWQRRVGLTTLAATTAGGPQRVTVIDVPVQQSVALACAVLPEVVGQFLAAVD